ncbi:lamin tail domain-containing protein [Candidatus Zixiibacteriota bacterium]
MKGLLSLVIITSLVLGAGLCFADVVINEVMYRASADANEDLQWVELYNTGPAEASIAGWILANHPFQGDAKSRDLIFPDGIVIPAGGYLLLVNDLDDSKDGDGVCFTDRWTVPAGAQALEYGRDFPQLSFERSGDDLHLSADGQKDIDAMWYGDGGEMSGFGAAPSVAEGSSLGRSPNGQDSDDPARDFMKFAHPTPGASNQSAPVTQRSTWSKIKLLFR